MEGDLNPTELNAQSGGQAEAVAPQGMNESPTLAAGRESVVGSDVNSDFAIVDTDVGADVGADAPNPDGAGQDGGDVAGAQTSPQGMETAATAGTAFQTREENSAIRAARIRARREAETALRAQMDEEIAQLGIADPYREGKRLRSMDDLRAYSQETHRRELAEQAQQTGRSVEDLAEDDANRRFLSALRQQSEQRAQEASAAQAQREWFERDVLDFVGKYPQFGAKELTALENNPQFRQFCGSRFGREPLATLYGDYLTIVGDAGKAAVSREAGKAARSTGGGGSDGAMLSPAQKSALDKWNAENPEMAMTAKEFLGR